MRGLLAIMEEEMDAYQRGGTPDFDLLRLILDYLVNYPEMCHHAREDAVYAVLLRRDPIAGAAVGNLMEEHRQLSTLTHRLAAAVANAEHDVEMPKEWLAALVREYLARYRAHMQAEEQHLFGRAIAALSNADWADVDAKLERFSDPLFGGKATRDYQRLHQRIMALRV